MTHKFFLVLFLTACGVMQAQAPVIVGHIPTEGGKAALTSEPCHDKRLGTEASGGYFQDPGGKITKRLCWDFLDDQILVVYEGVGPYTYPIDNVVLTPLYAQWLKDREKRKATPPPKPR